MAIDMPRLGLGTGGDVYLSGESGTEVVRRALEMGYRHVDTARMYGNEAAVGEGIARAEVPREEVFLATKVAPEDLGYDDALAATRESLRELGTDYLDLVYVHFPKDAYDPEETFRAFDELADDGVIRHIGVSNFSPALVEEARRHADHPIAANQVEMHPLRPQRDLVAYAREADLWVVAYTPLARGEVFDRPEVREVAKRHGITPAAATLAWLLAEDNVAAVPKTTSEDHLRDNLAAAGVDLDPADVALIDSIEAREKLVNPDEIAEAIEKREALLEGGDNG